MSDTYTDSTQWANFLATGYDKYLEYQLRSMPIFRQLVDKHPVDVTNPGSTVTLSIVQEFASLATTPLTENVDVALAAPPAPNRVSITLNEYGNAEAESLKLKTLAFAQVDPAVANVLGKNMVDSVDKLVQTTLDAATHIIGYNSGTIKSDNNSFAEGSVAGTDIMDAKLIRVSNALLRGRNVHGRDGKDTYLGLIHPDVEADILTDSGWLPPHQYQDTTMIYNGEVGQYNGVRFVTTPRATIVADGASSAKVYRSYFLGAQALAEAMAIEPHIVVGPQVDRLRRIFPIGWYLLGGWAIYRQEAIQIARTASAIGASSVHA